MARAAGNRRREEAFTTSLRVIAAGDVVLAGGDERAGAGPDPSLHAVGLFHASASLGIAEAAFARAARPGAHRRRRARPHAGRGGGDRPRCRPGGHLAGGRPDRRAPRSNPTQDGPDQEITALFAEGQAAKTFVNEAATRVVDRALALSGGAGYLNGSPLARA